MRIVVEHQISLDAETRQVLALFLDRCAGVSPFSPPREGAQLAEPGETGTGGAPRPAPVEFQRTAGAGHSVSLSAPPSGAADARPAGDEPADVLDVSSQSVPSGPTPPAARAAGDAATALAGDFLGLVDPAALPRRLASSDDGEVFQAFFENPPPRWSEERLAILRRDYPTVRPIGEICVDLNGLPGQRITKQHIRDKAGTMGLRRPENPDLNIAKAQAVRWKGVARPAPEGGADGALSQAPAPQAPPPATCSLARQCAGDHRGQGANPVLGTVARLVPGRQPGSETGQCDGGSDRPSAVFVALNA